MIDFMEKKLVGKTTKKAFMMDVHTYQQWICIYFTIMDITLMISTFYIESKD